MTHINSQPIIFHVIGRNTSIPSNVKQLSLYLRRDRWDDWGKYCTQFFLILVDEHGEKHDIGYVKIGQRGLKPHSVSPNLSPGYRKPDVPSTFEELEDDFFSIGQDEDYYAHIGAFGDTIREQVLSSMRDVAWDKERWEWANNEEVMGDSLLRFVTRSTVVGQFRRMANGDARVTPYYFTYSPPKRLGDGEPPYSLDFSVDPNSPIPTNVHVLIGRNGVGKTRLLSLMSKALVARSSSAKQSGKFFFDENEDRNGTFANVVSVSFSAFDDNNFLIERDTSSDCIGFSFIGIRSSCRKSSENSDKPKSLTMIAREFVESLKECRFGARYKRWISAINTLKSDPVFSDAQIDTMIDENLSNDDVRDNILKTFKSLSSGHKIVLLTITRLVEKVEEKTLVLIDEPEAHLHPPLLSAMTRAISELMVRRNGVAIVATHSPVILQEVPRSCVWILDRNLATAKAERPSIETFAESVGILSREVFKLELSRSGYHQLLMELYRKSASYDDALWELDGKLGAEGKAVLKGIFLNKDN